MAACARADYRQSVALRYVGRGFDILWSHSLTIITIPFAAFGVVSRAGSPESAGRKFVCTQQ